MERKNKKCLSSTGEKRGAEEGVGGRCFFFVTERGEWGKGGNASKQRRAHSLTLKAPVYTRVSARKKWRRRQKNYVIYARLQLEEGEGRGHVRASITATITYNHSKRS